MITRKDFYDEFGQVWGAILFHRIAAPLDGKGRLAVFNIARQLGAAVVLALWLDARAQPQKLLN